MESYTQWEILSARIPNSDGSAAPYPHRCIYLGESPKFPGKIIVMGITSDLSQRVKGFSVDMPWAEGGHPETGLVVPCIAQALWTDHIALDSVKRHVGYTPLLKQLEIARALFRRRSGQGDGR